MAGRAKAHLHSADFYSRTENKSVLSCVLLNNANSGTSVSGGEGCREWWREREREWCWWEIKAHPGKSAYRVHRVQTQQLNTLHLKTQTITKQNLLSLNLGLGEPN